MAGHDGWKSQPRAPKGERDGGRWIPEADNLRSWGFDVYGAEGGYQVEYNGKSKVMSQEELINLSKSADLGNVTIGGEEITRTEPYASLAVEKAYRAAKDAARSSYRSPDVVQGGFVEVTGNVEGNGEIAIVAEYSPSGDFVMLVDKQGERLGWYHLSDVTAHSDEFEDEDDEWDNAITSQYR